MRDLVISLNMLVHSLEVLNRVLTRIRDSASEYEEVETVSEESSWTMIESS